ncbi:unnamed protein product, partial [Durusdinium trenchii]
NYDGKQISAGVAYNAPANKAGYLLNQTLGKLMVSEIDDSLVQKAKQRKLTRISGFNELRGLDAMLVHSLGVGIKDFAVPEGLLLQPLKPTQVRLRADDGHVYIVDTKASEVKREVGPTINLSELKVLVTLSDQGPLNGDFYATKCVLESESGTGGEDEGAQEEPDDEKDIDDGANDEKAEKEKLAQLKRRLGTYKLAPRLINPVNLATKEILMSVCRATWKEFAERARTIKSPEDVMRMNIRKVGQGAWKEELVGMAHCSLSRDDTIQHLLPEWTFHDNTLQWHTEMLENLLQCRAASLASAFLLPPMRYCHVLSEDAQESKAAQELAVREFQVAYTLVEKSTGISWYHITDLDEWLVIPTEPRLLTEVRGPVGWVKCGDPMSLQAAMCMEGCATLIVQQMKALVLKLGGTPPKPATKRAYQELLISMCLEKSLQAEALKKVEESGKKETEDSEIDSQFSEVLSDLGKDDGNRQDLKELAQKRQTQKVKRKLAARDKPVEEGKKKKKSKSKGKGKAKGKGKGKKDKKQANKFMAKFAQKFKAGGGKGHPGSAEAAPGLVEEQEPDKPAVVEGKAAVPEGPEKPAVVEGQAAVPEGGNSLAQRRLQAQKTKRQRWAR